MSNEPHPIVEEERPQIDLPEVLSDDFINRLERGVENYKRYQTAIYKLTKESHWIRRKDRSGNWKYTLQAPGAEALMNPLAFSPDQIRPRKEELQDENGKYYRYWCEGIGQSGTLGRRGFYIGVCDSRDPFFNARRDWNPMSGEGDIAKAALSNWTVNAVSRLAGIRDPSEETLKAAGLDVNKIPSIDYDGGKTPQESTQLISEPQVKRLWAICKNKGISEDRIREYLKDKFSVHSLSTILRKDYETICAWAETGGAPDA